MTTNDATVTYLHTNTSTDIAVSNATANHVQNEQVQVHNTGMLYMSCDDAAASPLVNR